MSSKVNKRNKGKRKVRGMHTLDRDRLNLDAIYESKNFEVQSFYRQVIEEEDALAATVITRGETWNMGAYLNRVHMRMGARFFHLLAPVMQQRFMDEYPAAFTLFAAKSTAAPALAEAV